MKTHQVSSGPRAVKTHCGLDRAGRATSPDIYHVDCVKCLRSSQAYLDAHLEPNTLRSSKGKIP